MKIEAFIICSELNGDAESCEEEYCDSCSFKMERLDETVKKLKELYQGANKPA